MPSARVTRCLRPTPASACPPSACEPPSPPSSWNGPQPSDRVPSLALGMVRLGATARLALPYARHGVLSANTMGSKTLNCTHRYQTGQLEAQSQRAMEAPPGASRLFSGPERAGHEPIRVRLGRRQVLPSSPRQHSRPAPPSRPQPICSRNTGAGEPPGPSAGALREAAPTFTLSPSPRGNR